MKYYWMIPFMIAVIIDVWNNNYVMIKGNGFAVILFILISGILMGAEINKPKEIRN